MCKYIEELQTLNELYKKLDEKYFDYALTKGGRKSVITIQSAVESNGHFTGYESWSVDNQGMHEINISAENLRREPVRTAGTLLHEMIHEYCFYNQIKDTSRNGRYHNKIFKQMANERDLTIEYNKTIGWSITTPTEAFRAFIDSLSLPFQAIFRRGEVTEVKTKAKSSTRKLVCPDCGLTVRATKEGLKLLCCECDIMLEYQD